MAKIRSNFTLSPSTLDKLKEVDNMSETVEKAVDYYFIHKDEDKKPLPSKLKVTKVFA